jgi:hypothetical protein
MDDVILALRTLLLSGLTADLYKKVYYGPNLVPAKSELPCVEVIPVSTTVENLGTNSMRNEYTIQITTKDILKNHVTEDTDKSILSHVQTIVKRMEERDANAKPKSTTILGVLHDNRKISNTVHINQIGNIEYNTEEFNGSWIISASIIITALKINLRS